MEGEWVSVEEKRTEYYNEFEVKLLKKLTQQRDAAIIEQRELEENLLKAFPGDAPASADDGRDNISNTEDSKKEKFQPSGTHTMVLLGVLKTSRDHRENLYMLLNWWMKMPLVVVSVDYLKACGAVVHFMKELPGSVEELTRNHHLVSQCASPIDFDVDDEISLRSWFKDGIGIQEDVFATNKTNKDDNMDDLANLFRLMD